MAIKTNKEYLVASLKGLNVTEDDIDLIILKSDMDADAKADPKACDMAIYKRMSVVLGATMQNVTEGGFSLSWNMEAVKVYYNALCNELGVENVLVGRPKVRNRSNYW